MNPNSRKTADHRDNASGQELVEYALILPILLALLLGIMEIGLAVFNYNTMSNAAREAARKGVVSRNETAIINSGLQLTSATALTSSNFNIKWLNANGTSEVPSADAKQVRITVTRTYQLLSGGFLKLFGLRGTLPLTATATMKLE